MGASLVSQVWSFWAPNLPVRTTLVLARMAHTALDEPNGKTPAGMYWAGHDLLAACFPGGATELNRRAVRKAVTELVAVGAIERVERGYNGHRTVYRLTFS